MADEFQVQALGTQFRVIVTGMSGSEVRRLRHQWERCAGWGKPSETVTVARPPGGGEADVSGRTPEEVGVALRQTINLRAIMARRHDLLMFHAAGLADRSTGDVIALIGPSGAGKTTAAATLGACLGYVSDETVAVAADGTVVPFPKPLAVKRPGTRDKRVHGPDALGLAHADGRLHLSRIALLDRTEEPVAPAITTTPLHDVLSNVVEQISCFDALPLPLHRLSEVARRSGGVHVIRYHHAADLVDPVRDLLRRPTAAPEQPAYSRAHIDDWIDSDGEVLTIVGSRVMRLGPVGSLVWRLLERPLSVEKLVAPVEAVFGRAPDGDTGDAVRRTLDELVGVGLLAGPPADAEETAAEAMPAEGETAITA